MPAMREPQPRSAPNRRGRRAARLVVAGLVLATAAGRADSDGYPAGMLAAPETGPASVPLSAESFDGVPAGDTSVEQLAPAPGDSQAAVSASTGGYADRIDGRAGEALLPEADGAAAGLVASESAPPEPRDAPVVEVANLPGSQEPDDAAVAKAADTSAPRKSDGSAVAVVADKLAAGKSAGSPVAEIADKSAAGKSDGSPVAKAADTSAPGELDGSPVAGVGDESAHDTSGGSLAVEVGNESASREPDLAATNDVASESTLSDPDGAAAVSVTGEPEAPIPGENVADDPVTEMAVRDTATADDDGESTSREPETAAGDAAAEAILQNEIDIGTADDPAGDPVVDTAGSDAPGATAGVDDAGSQQPAADPEPAAPKPPVAENVDLSKPIQSPEPQPVVETPTPSDAPVPLAVETEPEPARQHLILLGSEVAPGTSARLSWAPDSSFAGIDAPTPVLVVNGEKPGPVLCLTAAVHGDELNGIEIVRRVLYDLEPKKLAGAVIGVPIVNLQGFRRGSRYLPDRRDLNRFFPGNPTGSAAARIAHSFFTEVVTHCDALVDIHTGSFHRTNLPQLRADLNDARVVQLTQGFGSTVVLQSDGAIGTLRRAAVNAGIPAVTLETGEPQRVQKKAVAHGAKGIQTLLNELGMVRKITIWGHREPVYYRSTWVRADQGGVLFARVGLGATVDQDQLLGTITDPITNVQSEVRAPVSGRILGMALNQFVLPGFAAFHIGIQKPVEQVVEPAAIAQEDASVQPAEELAGEAAATGQVPEPDNESDSQLDLADHLDDSE